MHDKSREILTRIRRERVSLRRLYQSCGSRSELVATFLSILELCSMGSAQISREGEDIVVSFVGGDVEEILERIEDI